MASLCVCIRPSRASVGPTWDMGKGTDVLHGHPRLPGAAPLAPSGSQNQGSPGLERTFKVI